MNDNLKSTGTRAFLWHFLGKMTRQGMGFVVSIFLARLLEPADFGLIAIVMVIIGIASVFTDVGLGAALIQRRRVHPVHYSSVFYFNLFIGLLLALVTCYSASWISEFYNNDKLTVLVQVMSVSFILGALGSVQSTRLRKELNYALLTKINIISSLVGGVVGIILAFLGAGVWSLAAQVLVQEVVYNALIWPLGGWRPSLEFSRRALTQLWGFGFRMFLSGMLDRIFTRLDFLIIGKLFPLATLGYFQRAKSLNGMVIQYSSGSLMAVLFPVLSKVQNDLPRFQNIIVKSLGIISFVVFMLLGMFYLVAEEIIVLLFSDKWLPSVALFKILVLSGFSYPISALLVNVLSSRGNSKAFLRLEIYKKIIASFNFVVLYLWGIDVFLYGLIVQSLLSVSLNILFASREIKLPFFLFVKPIIVQMLMVVLAVVATAYIVQDIALLSIIMLMIKGAAFILLYLLVNYLFRTASLENVVEQIAPIIKKKFKSKGAD